jgi:putative transposase
LGLPVPSRATIDRRIARMDSLERATSRGGTDAGRPLHSAGGLVPPAHRPLEQVQIDHTVVDVMVVDERHRLPIGRPYVTVAIDVFSGPEAIGE